MKLPLSVLLMGVVGVLAGGSLLLLAVPGLQIVVVSPYVDAAVNATATLIAAAVAALAWLRWRETSDDLQLAECAALLVLFASGCATLLPGLLGRDREAGLSLSSPGQLPLYVWHLARLVAGTTFLAGLVAKARPRPPRDIVLVLVPVGTFGLLAAAAAAALPALPDLISRADLDRIASASGVPSSLPVATPPGLALAIAGSALFIAAAFAALRWPIRDAGRSYLAVGLVVAAFGQLHAAIYPGFYSSLVTTSDALRLAFYAILLLGVLAGTRDDLRALRVAFAAIDRLRDGDRARAALEERSRLARELHDGLAQDLWLARLRAGEVARHVSRSGGGRRALADLTEAVDQGVIDARQAILALRAASRAGSFPDLVDASAGDFRDATGIPTEAEIGHDLPALAPRQEVELLGILHEALTNVRRHARAGRVRVALARDGDALVLEVGDDGRGFDPGALAAADRYGIRAMGERATLAGASLTVGSSPGAGTLIVVRAEPLRA